MYEWAGNRCADDEILDCALFYARAMAGARVVLLTSDAALRIKAKAHHLVASDAVQFVKARRTVAAAVAVAQARCFSLS
jgi:predicted ribonuclease YlaK